MYNTHRQRLLSSNRHSLTQLSLSGVILTLLLVTTGIVNSADVEWVNYGGDPGRNKYSALKQIHRGNVTTLEQAWVYHTGDVSSSFGFMECNPIVVDGVLYATTAKLKVIALDAATGELLWQFDPYAGGPAVQTLNRGVSYWRDQSHEDIRIMFTAGSFLYALNAADGTLVKTFGVNGRVDMRIGLGEKTEQVYVDATSPGVVFEDRIIIGTRVGEGMTSAPGHLRAYNVRSGNIEWTFHTIPRPGEYGYETWPKDAWRWAGGANAWGGVSLDPERGIVFAGTGSATYDYWGGNRGGDNLFANTVLALNAKTGERIWHFQTVHHDIWDRDLPTPPTLVTVEHGGRKIDAAVQLTKQGVIYLFDRETGQPLFPIEEQPVPQFAMPGELLAATQPMPVKPVPLTRQEFKIEDVNKLSEGSYQAILDDLKQYRLGPRFTSPSVEGTVMHPWMTGASGWGGGAFDPESRLLFVNSTDVSTIMKLLKIDDGMVGSGRAAFLQNCASCHGADLKGNGNDIPSLINISSRLGRRLLYDTLRSGRGKMPGFASLGFAQLTNIMDYLYTGGDDKVAIEESDGTQKVPYVLAGMTEFTGPDGYPAIKPPWGTLSAVDLDRGEIVWKVPLGEHSELTARGIPPTGTKNTGAPIVTAGGLVFIGATQDEMFRAFDTATGKLLWESELPGSAYAVPSTYTVNDRQYIVIAAGGGKGRRTSDAYVAFALP